MVTLTLKQNFPFAQNGSFCELEPAQIMCNDITLPDSVEKTYNPHNVRLWVIGHTFGAVCAVWASHEQDALNNAVDLNLMDWAMAENQDYDDENLTPLGNASELFDLSDVWLAEVIISPDKDLPLILSLVRAVERGADNLGEVI